MVKNVVWPAKTLKRCVAKKSVSYCPAKKSTVGEHFHFGTFHGCEDLPELITVKIVPVLSLH